MIDFRLMSGNLLQERSIKKNYHEEYVKIMTYTGHLEVPFIQRLWLYVHQSNTVPVCKTCKSASSNFDWKKGYSGFCSRHCALNNEDIKEKMKASRLKTSMSKYGTEHPMKTEVNRQKLSDIKMSYDDDTKKRIAEKRENTNLKKYGSKNPTQNKEIQEKRTLSFKTNIEQWKSSYRATSIAKYGTEHPWSAESVRETYRATMVALYGKDNPLKVEELKEKIRATNTERYGHSCIFKTDKSKNRIVEKYGHENVWSNREVIEKIKKVRTDNYLKRLSEKIPNFVRLENDTFIIKCNDCNDEYSIARSVYFKRVQHGIKTCTNCNKVYSKNHTQSIIYDFILELAPDAIINDRTLLNGKEIDIYIPSKQIAIEYNGVYWHSDIYVDDTYHRNKTELCELLGIQLIHLYEDDWDMKSEIVKSRIKNLLGLSDRKIHARKCDLRLVNSKESNLFLESNHIQGRINSKFSYGLYYEEELVSLMTFGSLRKSLGQDSAENRYEMLRFCNSLNTNVIGAAGRLFAAFVREYSPTEIISYADRSWSRGSLYYKLNFTLVDKGNPNYWYIIDGVRMHRYGYRKDVLVRQGYDPNKTEKQIMIDRGIYRLYDSGSLKFVWRP